MANTQSYAALSATTPLVPYEFDRRQLRPDDVSIEILYCGVCHSDLHFARNDWGNGAWPVVPGHEIIGRVTAVGPEVTKFKQGQIVGVGCMVDSCEHCEACNEGLEQYCLSRPTATYGATDRVDGSPTQGGYSTRIVVKERFVVNVPESLDFTTSAPVLCAGITTYSPLKHFGVTAGHKLGVIGMGGLGHMGVKLALAMGAEVTLFTRSQSKVEEAKRHGVHHVIVSTDDSQMAEYQGYFDFLLDTIPVQHDLNPYLQLLKFNGTHILVGLLAPIEPPLNAAQLVAKRKVVAGSLIGGMPETQEVLDFCAEHNIGCDVEVITIDQINDAWERMEKGDVKYRFVIDMQKSFPDAYAE